MINKEVNTRLSENRDRRRRIGRDSGACFAGRSPYRVILLYPSRQQAAQAYCQRCDCAVQRSIPDECA